MRSTSRMVSGWGNYPVKRCYITRPQTLAELQNIVAKGNLPDYIPRGLGRAYGDAALNDGSGVIDQTRFNRLLAFDEQTGVLECEAGVSFAEIIQHLRVRGWFVPTTPGTKYVTVGGAIAADVHGKNHHRIGSFGNFVLDLNLLTASGEILTCSRTQNADVFWATLGGMGLTGIILSARVQLVRVESAYCDVTYRRTTNLDETLECFSMTDKNYRYSVAWVDCLASGPSLGRSVLMLANDARPVDFPRPLSRFPLIPPRRSKKSVPIYLPSFFLNFWSVKAFNALYYWSHRNNRQFVDHDTFFYPLDNIRHWNRLYGRPGFVQYQALFPEETSRRGLIELLEKVVSSQMASFLAVLKSSGSASRGMLSYLYPGHTLTLDFPYRGEDLRCLLGELDEVLLKHGGRLYLAKDAMTSAEAFATMYSRLHEFKEIKAKIDPNNRFVSSQAKRLGLVETT